MNPLVIGPAERAAIADLIARAQASPNDLAIMQVLAEATRQGQHGIRAMNAGLTIEIPVGYSVTLTIEEHRPGVLCRHVSIGVETTQGPWPSPEAVQMLMWEFGFRHLLRECPTWLERLNDGSVAVNLLEPLDGDLDRLRDPAPGTTAV